MFRHYIVTAFRNLFRNRLFTTINLVGLSVSIVIFLALTGYVNYQFSFDKFYPGGDRIYRINYFEYEEGQAVLESARTHDRTAWLVHEYVPQVEAVARAYNEKAFVFSEDVRIVDQDMMFYLRTRGVSKEAARHLLTYAFAADVTRRIKVEPVRRRIEDYLAAQHGLPQDLRITDVGLHNEAAR